MRNKNYCVSGVATQIDKLHSLLTLLIMLPRLAIFGDARLEHIDHLLLTLNKTNAIIFTHIEGDAGLRGVASLAFLHLTQHQHDTVIISAGALDLIRWDNTLGRYVPAFNDTDALTDYIVGIYNEIDVMIHKSLPKANFFFCQQVGIELCRMKDCTEVEPNYQRVINESIVRINREITNINERNHVPTPWLARSIHRLRKQKDDSSTYSHTYSLLVDGLRPDKKLLQKWAKRLLDSIWRCT